MQTTVTGKRNNILITGGAGFIGANLIEALLQRADIGKIKVLDNLSTGFKKNIEAFTSDPRFEFIEGDIRDYDLCKSLCEQVDIVSHQAALGSVPRSIEDPLTTNEVNSTGTLNIFNAAVEGNVDRVVFAASSSTYGDSEGLPKVEHIIGRPLSPYAVTKYVNELYADVYARSYNFEYIGLRYFNIFGPKQDPNGAYAAVIPLFFKAAMENASATINGDGSFSRDFTYVENAVEANIKAMFTNDKSAVNQIYNVACGEQTSLNQLWAHIKGITQSTAEKNHGPNRKGDIPHSLADISKAQKLLGYSAGIKIEEGLERAYEWYAQNFKN